VWLDKQMPRLLTEIASGASFGFGRNLEGNSRGECGAAGIDGAPHFLLSTGKSKIRTP
jgi:hypothetical protein